MGQPMVLNLPPKDTVERLYAHIHYEKERHNKAVQLLHNEFNVGVKELAEKLGLTENEITDALNNWTGWIVEDTLQ